MTCQLCLGEASVIAILGACCFVAGLGIGLAVAPWLYREFVLDQLRRKGIL